MNLKNKIHYTGHHVSYHTYCKIIYVLCISVEMSKRWTPKWSQCLSPSDKFKGAFYFFVPFECLILFIMHKYNFLNLPKKISARGKGRGLQANTDSALSSMERNTRSHVSILKYSYTAFPKLIWSCDLFSWNPSAEHTLRNIPLNI